jgi:hypothetical protein
MIRIKESPHMKDVTPAELTKAQAKKLTKQIKQATDHLWYLLGDAHEGKAWKALGYSTWEAYVQAEFGMTKRRADQLLEQGSVVEAIGYATGKTGNAFPISKRDVDAVKQDLPGVTEEIKAKVDAGQPPEKAVAETIAAKRAEKEKTKAEKAAQQAENDRRREEHAAALPQAIKDREAAKADAIAARKTKPVNVEALTAEVEELRETNAALEAEVAALKADNAKWEAMRVQFEQGGFEKIIADKDEEIRVLQTRVEAESRDKASWASKAKYWKDEARKLGWKNGDFTIDLATGEIADA